MACLFPVCFCELNYTLSLLSVLDNSQAKNPLQFSSQYKMEDAVLLLAQYYFRFLFS